MYCRDLHLCLSFCLQRWIPGGITEASGIFLNEGGGQTLFCIAYATSGAEDFNIQTFINTDANDQKYSRKNSGKYGSISFF